MTYTNIKMNDLSAQWKEIKEDCAPEVEEYLDSGVYIGSSFIKRFEDAWSSYTGVSNSILMSNATDAHRVALEALQINGATTCVLLPNNTWPSILWVTKQIGFHYDFIDCDEYLQIDTEKLEYWLKNHRHKWDNVVIVATPMLGHMCDIVYICKTLATKYNCFVFEDASQSHGASWTDGRHIVKAGDLSDIAYWSFYPGKNLGNVGEAGAISTNNDTYAHRMRAIINCGMIEKNKFITEGGNDRPDGISAIVLWHKLKKLSQWNYKRAQVARWYFDKIEDKSVLPKIAKYVAIHSWHYFYVLPEKDITPHLDIPFMRNYPFTLAGLEGLNQNFWRNSYKNSKTIVCLPCHPYLSEEEVNQICNSINTALNKI